MPEPELKQTVYVETTIPSYLKARPTTDLIRAAHQEFTRQWWRLAPPRFRLVISDAVMSEVRAGDPAAAAGRLEAVAGLPILGSNEDVQKLLKAYEEASLLPANARADLLHLAFSTAFRCDQLITWNCRHIANPHVVLKLTELNKSLGWPTPFIMTPEQSLAMM